MRIIQDTNKGVFVGCMSLVLLVIMVGYGGYKYLTHKPTYYPQLPYPLDQRGFLDALIDQKVRYDDATDNSWKAGMNAIKASDALKEKFNAYGTGWSPILHQPQMTGWVGTMGRLNVIPNGNRQAGQITFRLACPLIVDRAIYVTYLSPDGPVSPTSTLGKRLRDINNGDVVTFSARLMDYFTVEISPGFTRTLSEPEATNRYMKELSGDNRIGFTLMGDICEFEFTIRDIEVIKVTKPSAHQVVQPMASDAHRIDAPRP